jgi:hypothetical protein
VTRGTRSLRRFALLVAGLLAAALAVAACGGSSSSGSSGNARQLLSQTFGQTHKINSGNLNFNVTFSPNGSSTLKGPLTISFGGPFQSEGTGKLPKSDFNIAFSGLGKSGSLRVLSTGTTGFITLKGVSYQMPAATFKQLETSFSQFGGGATSNNGNVLGGLGNPLGWLTNPSVVGSEQVGGAPTTHIRAGVNVAALLGDLDKLLAKAPSVGGVSSSTLRSMSPATRQRIASTIKNPKVDVWTGQSDKTIRKLLVTMTLPISGQLSAALGGLSSAGLSLQVSYANLNQPQTISAPANVRPFTEFSSKLQSALQGIQGAVAGGLGGLGSAGGTGATGSPGTSSVPVPGANSGQNVQQYTQCIQSAGGDVTKMQKCASLLNSGG